VRIVEIPVRIIGREHQPVRQPGRVLQQLQKLPRLVRLLHRLRRQPEVLTDVLRRRLLQLRHLLLELLPGRVEPSGQRRQPGEAALDQHDLQRRELLEDALTDEADQLRLKSGRHAGVVFEVH